MLSKGHSHRVSPENATLFHSLADDDFVSLPRYESPLHYNPRILEPLQGFALALKSRINDNSRMPNAVMHVAPLPCDQRANRLTYLVAWGDKVKALPHPRHERLTEYFGSITLAKMKLMPTKPYIKPVMDGYGFIGRIGINILNAVEMGVYMNDAHGNPTERWYPVLNNTNELVDDILHGISQGSPLRIHSGIRYIPHNQYMGIEFFRDDQQRTVPITA